MAEIVDSRWSRKPRFGIVLGTGANQVAEKIEVQCVIPYRDLPGFPDSTALGHKGQFVCGQLSGQPIIAMQGRFHLYEGYSELQIAQPIELMHFLGMEMLFITNASGGLNPDFATGDVMLIESHIDLMFRSGEHPAQTMVLERPSSRVDVYDRKLMDQADQYSRQDDFSLFRGVYAGLVGPNYETRAEYRMLRRIGADVVGMSTIPEVIVAARLGIRVMACSIVANVASPDALEPNSGQAVIDAASAAAPRIYGIFVNSIRCESEPP